MESSAMGESSYCWLVKLSRVPFFEWCQPALVVYLVWLSEEGIEPSYFWDSRVSLERETLMCGSDAPF
jgi:hypothetical protein